MRCRQALTSMLVRAQSSWRPVVSLDLKPIPFFYRTQQQCSLPFLLEHARCPSKRSCCCLYHRVAGADWRRLRFSLQKAWSKWSAH